MTGFRQFITFSLVGCVNTAIGLVTIFVLQSGLGADPFVANPIGYAAGLVNSFLMNRALTFRGGDRSVRAALRFLIAFAIAYIGNLATLVLFLSAMPERPMWGQAAAMAVYTVVFFILSRLFVFRIRA